MDLVEEIRRIALSMPEATEELTWDDINFRVRKKIFCFPASDGMTVNADPEELDALLGDPRFVPARYVGRFGWVSLVIDGSPDLDEVRELILTSYGRQRVGDGPLMSWTLHLPLLPLRGGPLGPRTRRSGSLRLACPRRSYVQIAPKTLGRQALAQHGFHAE